MISYLKGRIILSRIGFVVLDVNGTGYKVFVNTQAERAFNAGGEKIELFIYECIREDSDDLYGFLTYQELELFEKLISVNGVGPKAALNIMSSSKPDQIIKAIVSDDISFFIAISGIGKKVAAKIILELKSKVSADKSISIIGKMDDSDDLISALEALGYKKTEFQSLMQKIPAEVISLEEKVRWCLKNISK